MTSRFQPPPTWALPVIVDEKTGISAFNPIWLKWFVDLSAGLTGGGAASGDVSGPGSATSDALVVFNGASGKLIKNGPGLGTSTQVLHGNAGGFATWGAVNLATDVTGTLSSGAVSLQRNFMLMGA